MPAMSLSRRQFLTTSLAVAPALAVVPRLAVAETRRPWAGDPEFRLAELEQKHGGRLGVFVLDTGSGAALAFRAHDRFAMCSTFKWLLAAQVLAAVDAGTETLDRRVTWTQDEVIAWSPTVEQADGASGLTVRELCAAAVAQSDNTAANLLLASHGGPAGFTAWLRTTGDATTRLDRNEPTLNEAAPDDVRDTTTPAAMAASLQRVLLGDVLSPASRRQLTDWMLANTTGDSRLRAGLPGWKVGDKTGSDGESIVNDVAIAWPPNGGAPRIVAAFYVRPGVETPARDTVIAEVARIAADWAPSA